MIAGELNKAWGQPVLVENRAGAGGSIGALAVATAPADGVCACDRCPTPTHAAARIANPTTAVRRLAGCMPTS